MGKNPIYMTIIWLMCWVHHFSTCGLAEELAGGTATNKPTSSACGNVRNITYYNNIIIL